MRNNRGEADSGVVSGLSAQVRQQCLDNVENITGVSSLRGRVFDALRHQLSGGEVYPGALNPGATDVDSQCSRHGRVRISAPVSVTTRVCSNCAERDLSFVVTVQPSSHISQWIVPRVNIGSMVKTIPGTMSWSKSGAAS